jgi:hypothetical protein
VINAPFPTVSFNSMQFQMRVHVRKDISKSVAKQQVYYYKFSCFHIFIHILLSSLLLNYISVGK